MKPQIEKIKGGYAVIEDGKFGATLREATGPEYAKAQALLAKRLAPPKPEYQVVLEQAEANRKECIDFANEAISAGIKRLDGVQR